MNGSNTFIQYTSSSTSSDQPVEVLDYHNVDLLDYEDIEEVQHLCNDDTTAIFNVTDPMDLIHRCFLSYKLTNSNKQIVAAMVLDEYPNLPGLPIHGWSPWAANLYNLRDLNSYNSVWVHMAVYDPAYKYHFLHPILNRLLIDNEKEYIFFVIPKGCHSKVDYLEVVSTVMLPEGFTDPQRIQTLRMCRRSDFLTPYRIRYALEEDNDYIVPLIASYSPRFEELYGKFYIAEIISSHPETARKVFVAELQSTIKAVMCLNPYVNFEQLQECFDLNVFTGLYKASTAEQQSTKQSLVPVKSEPLRKSHHQKEEKEMKSVQLEESRRLTRAHNISRMSIRDWLLGCDNSVFAITDDDRDDSDSVRYLLDDLGAMGAWDSSSTSSETPSELRSLVSDGISLGGTDDSEYQMSFREMSSHMHMAPFCGEENAFAVEILAAFPGHKTALVQLLVLSFEVFPDKDYCVLMVSREFIPGAFFKYFVRVAPRMTTQHPHDLYVCHRGQLSALRVMTASASDRETVADFAGLIEKSGNIMENFDNPDITTYLALSSNMPVGLAQVGIIQDIRMLKVKYSLVLRTDVRRDCNSKFGYLLNCCMSPMFSRLLPYFLRSIHRFTGLQNLLYGLNKHDASEHRIRPMSPAIRQLVLVPPRKHVYHEKELITYPEEPFALYICTPRLLAKPIYEVNQRIVVVGASMTALAFLESLMISKSTAHRVIFNNLLLVSTHGMPRTAYDDPCPVRDMFLARKTLKCCEHWERIALCSMVSVVTGSVVGLHRKQQQIQLTCSGVIPYDYLFLMTGLQYNIPRKPGMKNVNQVVLPSNCFTINTKYDAEHAIEKTRALIGQLAEDQPYEILIYGSNVDAYCCVAALLKLNVPGKYINLIEPPPEDPSCEHDFTFQVGEVYEAVVNATRAAGVLIADQFYKLTDWCSNPFTLKFASRRRQIIRKPLCAYIYTNRSVGANIFSAIYDAALVFDGRLVIDRHFCTNDKSIFAAGPLTKYTRRMFSDHLVHRYFSSEEIGRLVASQMLAKLLPKLKAPETVVFKRALPVFDQPLMTYCQLPRGLYYLNVCQPGPPVPLEAAMTDNDYGSVFVTGNSSKLQHQGYFRIHTDHYRTVATITCLSQHPFDYKRFVMLWGKHEALLNDLMDRFQSARITDLYSYFNGEWCSAIFLDDFSLLEEEIMKIMTSLTDVPGESPIEELIRFYLKNGFRPLSKDDRRTINWKFQDSGYQQVIENKVMKFITDNLDLLDMYAHPIGNRYLLGTFEESFLFKQI